METETVWHSEPKIFITGPLQEMFANSCFRGLLLHFIRWVQSIPSLWLIFLRF